MSNNVKDINKKTTHTTFLMKLSVLKILIQIKLK